MARRSLLFTPGDRPEMLRKAPGSGADVLVFDLEDAVAPGRKAEARAAVAEVLAAPGFDPDAEVCVRVNPTGIAADDDLDGVLSADARLDSVMLPKVDGPGAVDDLADLLAEHGRSLPVIALVETAAGILHAEAIAAAEATDALFFGAEDLAADLGASRTAGGDEVAHARQHVVLAAAAAGVDAIDTVYTDIEDLEGLRAAARRAVGLGFDGKPAVHPSQVEPINAAFVPEEAELTWARRVLDAAAEADDRGVFAVDGQMIDEPLLRRARRLVERADAAENP
ncbi:MAG: CoA ester lyase [Halobacteriales archaeon]|nr:CoA ester lyase [Halobacteriales archaeon]